MIEDIKNMPKDELQKIISDSTSISEVLKRLGYPGKGSYHTEMTKFLKESNFDTSTLAGRHLKRYCDKGIKRKLLSEILTKNSTGNSNYLRNRLIACGVKEYKCENPECGIKDWHGKQITLQLHHINGDHYDNRLENLVILCPNCHSQTSNFGSNNSSDVLNKILSKVAINESKTSLENLLRFEKARREEILENRKKYGAHSAEEIIKRKKEKEAEKLKNIRYCVQCGKRIEGRGEKFCSVKCMTKYQREHSKYSIEDVIKKATECTSIVKLASYFGVSDKGLVKRLKNEKKLDVVKEILNKNKCS